MLARSPPVPVSPGSAGDEPPPAPRVWRGLVLCVLPPDGGRGGTLAEGDRADEDLDQLRRAGWVTAPPPSGATLLREGGGCRGRVLSPQLGPLSPPRPPFAAGGATRAAREGAALSVVSGAPARAGSSCRQRTFIGRSVGTAESPEPPTPSMSGDPTLRLPRARASWLFGGWRSQFSSFQPASPVGPGGLWALGRGSRAALSAASQGWRAAAGGWIVVGIFPRTLADSSP